jgi:hypothetical protein
MGRIPRSAPGPTQESKPELVADPDEIPAITLGPTLAQLQEKAKDGTLTGADLSGYLALVQAFSEIYGKVPVEYLGTHPQQIAGEVLSLIAEKIVGLRTHGKLANKKREEVTEDRDRKICKHVNNFYPPGAKAAVIAEDLLATFGRIDETDEEAVGNLSRDHRALYDLLRTIWKPKQGAWGLMSERTLRDILGKRESCRK